MFRRVLGTPFPSVAARKCKEYADLHRDIDFDDPVNWGGCPVVWRVRSYDDWFTVESLTEDEGDASP